MRGEDRHLVNPPTRLGDFDLEASRAERQRIHEEVRQRQFIGWLLNNSSPGDGLVSVQRLGAPASDEADESAVPT